MAIEAKQRLAQRQRDFQKEVETQYSDYRREAMVAAEKFRSAKEDCAGLVRAPVDKLSAGCRRSPKAASSTRDAPDGHRPQGQGAYS